MQPLVKAVPGARPVHRRAQRIGDLLRFERLDDVTGRFRPLHSRDCRDISLAGHEHNGNVKALADGFGG